jgi:MFS family permease
MHLTGGTGIVFLLIFPSLSDRIGNRQWFIVGGLGLGFISAVICVSQQHNVVRYVFLCFYIAGLYTTLPLILNWASETINQPAEKRAVVIAFINCIGSISSIYGSYLWPSTDAPKYTKGFATVSTFLGIGIIIASTLPILARFLPKYQTKAMREIEAEE